MTSLVPVIRIKQKRDPPNKEPKESLSRYCVILSGIFSLNSPSTIFYQKKIILMENQNTQQPSLCRAGCGFYGNSTFDGMCSQCFKDALRRTQSTSPTGRISPVSTSVPAIDDPSPATTSDTTLAERTSEEREQPVVEQVEQATTSTITTANEEENKEDSPSKTKRKNRCTTCRKKVGLTGFQCRCGGLFCSMHRYSDKHECSFDYKAEGQAEIRKNNPVVVRDKVQKL